MNSGAEAHVVIQVNYLGTIYVKYSMIGSLLSEYGVVVQFHNLKRMGSVGDYVDKFEELVNLVKRNDASLSQSYTYQVSYIG